MEKKKILGIVEKVVKYTLIVARFIATIFGAGSDGNHNHPNTPAPAAPETDSPAGEQA